MSEYHGCELPEDLWYDLDYLWARPNDDGTFTIGLTDPAQTMAGRVVAATFRKPGTHRRAGRHLGTLESGKWVGGIPAPFDGTIERVNPAVVNDPGHRVRDPVPDGPAGRHPLPDRRGRDLDGRNLDHPDRPG